MNIYKIQHVLIIKVLEKVGQKQSQYLIFKVMCKNLTTNPIQNGEKHEEFTLK